MTRARPRGLRSTRTGSRAGPSTAGFASRDSGFRHLRRRFGVIPDSTFRARKSRHIRRNHAVTSIRQISAPKPLASRNCIRACASTLFYMERRTPNSIDANPLASCLNRTVDGCLQFAVRSSQFAVRSSQFAVRSSQAGSWQSAVDALQARNASSTSAKQQGVAARRSQ